MAILDMLGNEVIDMMSTGRVDKAIFYVYLVDLFDNVDDDKDFKQENDDVLALQDDLMKKAKEKTGPFTKLTEAAKGRAENAINSFIPGNKTSEYVGEIDQDHDNFVKVRVQYNPNSIKMRTINGRQEKKVRDGSMDDNLRAYDSSGKTKLSFDLIFDDVDNMDAFGLNELANVNGTSLINKGVNEYKKGFTAYSVRKRMDAMLSLLSSVATQQVVFCWAKMSFRGQLTDVSNKYTMFNSKGNPIRGEMHIEITQDAGQKELFSYDEKYWNEAFERCFSEEKSGFDGASKGSSVADKLRNNSLINLGI